MEPIGQSSRGELLSAFGWWVLLSYGEGSFQWWPEVSASKLIDAFAQKWAIPILSMMLQIGLWVMTIFQNPRIGSHPSNHPWGFQNLVATHRQLLYTRHQAVDGISSQSVCVVRMKTSNLRLLQAWVWLLVCSPQSYIHFNKALYISQHQYHHL